MLGFPFEPERDSLQELFFNEDDNNKTELERSSSRVSQAVEGWCKCNGVMKQIHITWMVMLEADPGSLLGQNWKPLLKIFHGFQMLATDTKGSITDVKISEFQPL